ncbi:MAG TPA: hypothetical protein VJL28_15160 [Gemmatimonadaceae bacterium]|nr:hypothetical protein [Gemmatimonadaceae bacterium]
MTPGTTPPQGLLEGAIAQIRAAWLGKRRHAYNVSSFIVLRSLALGTFAISVPIFINSTSVREYGIVAIGFSLLGLTTLLEVGVGYVITQSAGRRLARTGKSYPRLLARVFWIYLGAAVAIAAILATTVLLLTSLSSAQRTLYLWLTALLPFLAISGTVAAAYQANNDLVYLNSSRFLFEFGKGIALAASGWFLHGSQGVGPILLLIACGRACSDLYAVNRRYGYSPALSNISMTKRALSVVQLGSPVMGCAALFLSVTIGDKLLIAHYLGTADVASYALAADISTKAYLLVHATNSSIFALILRDHAVKQDVSRFVSVSLVSVLAVVVLFYLPFGWNAERLISWWINPVMGRQTATIARVMAASAVVYLVGNAFENALLAMGKARLVFLAYACSVASFFASIVIQLPDPTLLSFGASYFLMSAVYATAVFAGFRHSKVRSGKFRPRPVAGMSTAEIT